MLTLPTSESGLLCFSGSRGGTSATCWPPTPGLQLPTQLGLSLPELREQQEPGRGWWLRDEPLSPMSPMGMVPVLDPIGLSSGESLDSAHRCFLPGLREPV